jgi:hypothetical protein
MYEVYHVSGATNATSAELIRRRLRAAPLTLAGMALLAGLSVMHTALPKTLPGKTAPMAMAGTTCQRICLY